MKFLSTNPQSLTTTGATPATGIASITLDNNETLANFTISGTYGTVQLRFEISYDGTNFAACSAIRLDTGVTDTSTISPADNTTRSWNVPCTGAAAVRLYIVAIGSGTVSCWGQAGAWVGHPTLGTAGGNAVTNTVTNQLVSASGAITTLNGTAVITKTGSLAACTLAAPTAGTDDYKVLVITSDTAFAHTVTCSAGVFKNGGAAVTIFTFTGTTSGGGLTLEAYNGTWKVLSSVGGAFS